MQSQTVTSAIMDSAKDFQPLSPGTRLPGLRIDSVIGSGAFGVVYGARKDHIDERVAIKEFLPRDLARRGSDGVVEPYPGRESDYDWARDKFLAEARTLHELASPLPHPNLVQVFLVLEENGTVYMCMRFEEGRPLDAILAERTTLSEHELKALLGPLLDGLEHAHAKRTWHRDIKPSNILIRPDGTPVLIDFGAAKRDQGNGELSQMAQFTPGYAAPEQQWGLADNTQGPWTDIYALGATLYQAVTGQRPEGLSPDPRGAVVAGQYSAAFLNAIAQAVAFDPKQRPQSIDQWRGLLLAEGDVPSLPVGEDAATVLTRLTGAPVDQTLVSAQPDLPPIAPSQPEMDPVAANAPTEVSSIGSPQPIGSPDKKGGGLMWPILAATLLAGGVAGAWIYLAPPPSPSDPTAGVRTPVARAEHVASAEPEISPAQPEPVPALPPVDVGEAAAAEHRLRNALAVVEQGGVDSSAGDLQIAAVRPEEPGGGAGSSEPSPLEESEPEPVTRSVGEEEPAPREFVDVSEPEPEPEVLPPEPEPGPGPTPAQFAAEIEASASSLGCARVSARVQGDLVVVEGFVADSADRSKLRLMIDAEPGVTADERLRVLPRPLCAYAERAYGMVAGGSATQPAVGLNNASGDFANGEFVEVEVGNRSVRPGWLYVDLIDASGETVHMLPSPTKPENRARPGERILIGGRDDEQRFEVMPPHGDSLLLATWSPAPLFVGVRPIIEDTADYLKDLGSALGEVGDGYGALVKHVRTHP